MDNGGGVRVGTVLHAQVNCHLRLIPLQTRRMVFLGYSTRQLCPENSCGMGLLQLLVPSQHELVCLRSESLSPPVDWVLSVFKFMDVLIPGSQVHL